MKNIITLIAVFFTAQIFAMSHELIMHNGEKLDVNFIKIENNMVYYALPNSMEVQKISRFAVAKLTEKAKNNSNEVSKKIIFAEKPDAKKVIVLNQSETAGLTKAETFKSFATIAKGETRWSASEFGTNSLKKKAASKGYQFIVITSNSQGNYEAVGYTY